MNIKSLSKLGQGLVALDHGNRTFALKALSGSDEVVS
jgi:hypothetical protein